MVENRRNLRIWLFCRVSMPLQICAYVTLTCKLADSSIWGVCSESGGLIDEASIVSLLKCKLRMTA